MAFCSSSITFADFKKLVELVPVGIEDLGQPLQFEHDATLGKAEENGPGVRAELTQDQPLKVTIVGDKHSAFTLSNG